MLMSYQFITQYNQHMMTVFNGSHAMASAQPFVLFPSFLYIKQWGVGGGKKITITQYSPFLRVF